MSEPVNRRGFITKIGYGAGIAGIGAQATVSARSLVPNVSYDPPTTVKVGPPGEFPDGMKFLPDVRLFVFRKGKTFHAISAVCTHLGCTVRAEVLEGGYRFLCPCHGSKYQGDGENLEGPAPSPLPWYRLSLAPDDGQLVVDLVDRVTRDFRLTID